MTLFRTDIRKAFRTSVSVAAHLGRLPPVLITQAVVKAGLLVSGNVTVRKTYRNRWQAHKTKARKVMHAANRWNRRRASHRAARPATGHRAAHPGKAKVFGKPAQCVFVVFVLLSRL